MNLKNTIALLTVATTILLIGCSESNENNPLNSSSIRGSGIIETQPRSVTDFDELVLSAAGEVNITFGSPQSVSVTVDENIMPYLETVPIGKRLDIRVKNGINAVDYDLVVNVVVPQLTAIELKGAGCIVGDNPLHTSHFDLALTGTGSMNFEIEAASVNTVFSGPGSVTLAGIIGKHTCIMSSAGNLRAYALATEVTDIAHSGTGRAEIRASDTLNAVLTGLGSVYYVGNPTIVSVQTGLGHVINAN